MPDVTGLIAGNAETFSIVELLSDGHSGKLDAQWSTDRPDILSVGSGGTVQATTFGTALLTATRMDLTLTKPLGVVNDFAGDWAGQFRYKTCSRQSGGGSSPCRFLEGFVAPISIQLTQSYDRVGGSMQLYSPDTVAGRIRPESGGN